MDSLLHDYGGLIAPAAAIINGFIAVVVAQFFKDHPIAKIILVVAAGVLGVAAIGATFYSQHQIVADKLANTQRRKEVREQLGVFISDGLGLIRLCSDGSKPPPFTETDAWAARLMKYISENLGASYIARLESPAGVPVNVVIRGDEEHNKVFRVINGMLVHLEQFSQEATF